MSTEPQELRPSKRNIGIMILLSMTSFMAALDSTILVTILPLIARELHGSAIDSFWAGTSYLLTSAVTQPFIAAVAEVFGPRVPLWFSVFLFAAGSIICGLAKEFKMLLAGRFIEGIGGGGIVTLVQTIFAGLVPLRQRPKWFTTVLISWAIGSVLGPFVGSSLMSHVSFRWVFWINLPLCGIVLVTEPLLIHTKSLQIPLLDAFARIDWVGCFLFILSSISLLVGLSWGGVQFPWDSKWTLITISVGSIGILCTLLWERHRSTLSFLHHSILPSRSAVVAYCCATLHGLILFCTLYYIPFYFASVQLRTPIESSVCLLPISCSLLPGAGVISQLISRTGTYRWAIWSGWVFTTTGAGLFLLLDEDTRASTFITIFVIFGLGNGSLLTALNFGIQSMCTPEVAGRAAGTYTFVRSFGMALGVTVGGNVFLNAMIQRLHDFDLPDTIAHDAEAYVHVLRTLDKSGPQRQAIIAAYNSGFHGVFLVLLGCCICGLVLSAFVKHHSMDQEAEGERISMTNQRL